jgi:RimJ/RimL family protein N-acetyltransferase
VQEQETRGWTRWRIVDAAGEQLSDPRERLWAYAAVEHVATRRVLEKAGFTVIDIVTYGEVPCALYVLDAAGDKAHAQQVSHHLTPRSTS